MNGLSDRLIASTKAIVWLCGLPGTGKTRLLATQLSAPAAAAIVLDRPSPEALRAALDSRPPRLVVATRPTDAAAALLATPRLYGRVDFIGDADLFWSEAHCRAHGGARLFADTGGWPVLVEAWRAGRADEMRRLLPDFLEAEVLPNLDGAVATALLGALAAPLGAAAVAHLFPDGGRLHPLLTRGAAGLQVAGAWTREALLELRTRPSVLRGPPAAGLMSLYTRFLEPVQAILSLTAIRQFDAAADVFEHAGGMYFGYRHGYRALEQVLEAFGPERARGRDSLFLAGLFLLIKSGRPREALLRLEAQMPGLPVDLRRLRLTHRPHALLLRAELSLDIDEAPPTEVVESWGRLETLFAPDDDLARGLLYNTMAIGFLQADELPRAEALAAEALSAYRRADSPYLVHFMELHRCDLALRHGRLRDAGLHLRSATAALERSGLAFNSEDAIIRVFAARLAYEEGRFEDCPEDIEPTLQALLRGDSWPDLLTSLAGHVVFAALWRHSLAVALDRLDRCALTLSRRHGPWQTEALTLLKVRLYQGARRHAEADRLLEEYDLEPAVRRSAHLEAEEQLIRLRQSLLGRRPPETALERARALAAQPRLNARHRISLLILRAYLGSRTGQAVLARREISAALRLAEAENLLGVLVEDGQFLERLLPPFIANPGAGNARLAGFAGRVLRLLHTLPATPLQAKALAGISRQEHRVLTCLNEGYTNKEIGRALLLSESTVKFHLHNLFAKLRVPTRSALLEETRRLGLLT